MNTFRLSFIVWFGLLGLLALTVGITAVASGPVAYGLNLLCAFGMAALIFGWFMGLYRADGLLRVFALAAVLWLALLIGITLLDYLARGIEN